MAYKSIQCAQCGGEPEMTTGHQSQPGTELDSGAPYLADLQAAPLVQWGTKCTREILLDRNRGLTCAALFCAARLDWDSSRLALRPSGDTLPAAAAGPAGGTDVGAAGGAIGPTGSGAGGGGTLVCIMSAAGASPRALRSGWMCDSEAVPGIKAASRG